MALSSRSRNRGTRRHAPLRLAAFLLLPLLAGVFGPLAADAGEPTRGADPAINEPFRDGEYQRWQGIFERRGREVYDFRYEILDLVAPRPGMDVADIGAGTGLFTRLFAQAVGSTGQVFAVDISNELVRGIERDAAERGLGNVVGVVNRPGDTGLEPASLDIAFICDTYHHFERPQAMMRSLYKALRPGGRLILIDFEREPGVSPNWILSHVRAGKEVFADEVRRVGFVFEREADLMRQNYVLIFTKPGRASNDRGGAEMGEDEVLYDANEGGLPWRRITDGVMGGLSSGELRSDHVADRACLRLRGRVRLDNNGGFLQMAADLNGGAPFDASAYRGLAIDVHGNDEAYKLHLRTDATTLPWQSYRADFVAAPHWQRLHIPFADFRAYRLDTPLDTRRLRRIGLVAIGRAFEADVCLARLALYR